MRKIGPGIYILFYVLGERDPSLKGATQWIQMNGGSTAIYVNKVKMIISDAERSPL